MRAGFASKIVPPVLEMTAVELNEGPDGPELRVSADAELRVDGLDVVSTLEDLESRLSTIEGLCVNDTAVEDDGL